MLLLWLRRRIGLYSLLQQQRVVDILRRRCTDITRTQRFAHRLRALRIGKKGARQQGCAIPPILTVQPNATTAQVVNRIAQQHTEKVVRLAEVLTNECRHIQKVPLVWAMSVGVGVRLVVNNAPTRNRRIALTVSASECDMPEIRLGENAKSKMRRERLQAIRFVRRIKKNDRPGRIHFEFSSEKKDYFGPSSGFSRLPTQCSSNHYRFG